MVWNNSLVVPDPKQPKKLSFTGWRLYWNYSRQRTFRKWYHSSVGILSACGSQTLKLSGRQTCRGTLDRGDLIVWIRYLNVFVHFIKQSMWMPGNLVVKVLLMRFSTVYILGGLKFFCEWNSMIWVFELFRKS